MARKATRLDVGQVWLPASMLSDAAPRQIGRFFTDRDGTPWLTWNYPGFPATGAALSEASFRVWVRRNQANPVEWKR